MNSYKQSYANYELYHNSKGLAHRTDGTAVTYPNGYLVWYLNDIRYRNNQSFQEAAGISDEDMIAMVLKYGNVI